MDSSACAAAESSRSSRNGSASPKSEPSDNARDHSLSTRYRSSPSPATSGPLSKSPASRDIRMEESRSRSRSQTISPPRPSRSRSQSRSQSQSRSRSRSRSLSDASMSSSLDSRTVRSNSASNSASKTALRIDHLTHNVRESHLRHIFGWYGQVERVHLAPAEAKGRDMGASAYVMMRSIEQAAKAALYMTNGQIDGAAITIKTCEPLRDLSPERIRRDERQRYPTAPSRGQRGEDYRHRSNHFRSSSHSNSNSREDRDQRSESTSTGPRHDRFTSGGMHPERRRLIGDGSDCDPRSHPDRFDKDKNRDYGHPKHMKRWQRFGDDPSPSPSRTSRRRESSRSRSLSPPWPHRRRRSSATMRASPSY